MMTPEDAQQTAVVRLAGFLSPADTDDLAAALAVVQDRQLCGSVERDAQGQQKLEGTANWRTTFSWLGLWMLTHFSPRYAAPCRPPSAA